MRFIQSVGLVALGVLPLGFTGCTAKYQERISDLNDRIVQFQTELEAKQTENRELMGKVRRLKGENDALRKRPKPIPAAGPRKVGKATWDPTTGKLTISNRVSFSPGSYNLSKEGKSTLRQVATFLKRNFGGRRIYVMGHTDNQPLKRTKNKYTSNRDLAARRAEAVALYLSGQGLTRRALAIVGFGDTAPVTSNKTDAGRAKNRRTEIRIGPGL